MSTALAIPMPFGLQAPYGCSEASKKIRIELRQILDHAEQSIVLGWRKELRNRLAEIIPEISERGWDGYAAEPVSTLAILTIDYLIDLLPETAPLPDIVPSTNGEIALEWDRDDEYHFSIRTHKGTLLYAGLFGSESKRHGQERLIDEIPQPIAAILSKYFSRS